MKTLENSGKLKIGDNWNAITIIALSQNNPLKAIAEFVENSIDAQSKNISIIRGKIKGEHFLKVIDDGEGISDFKYVATHIGDSIKKQLKKKGIKGIQGEFGIGLLSFWTVGDELTITSTSKNGITYRMKLIKNNPAYSINPVHTLFQHQGTELLIKPVLSGIRQFNGEKIQNYLASELRDRIIKTDVKIKIIDRTARKEFIVEPRKFKGRLLHNLPEPKNPLGEIYCELYISDPDNENQIGLYKCGTRIISNITKIDSFKEFPWTSGYLEGIIDVSFLQLTPGTRDGVVYDDSFESFVISIESVKDKLSELVKEQQNAEDEKASENILKKVKKALKEAFLMLPQEEYHWLDILRGNKILKSDDNSDHNKGKILSDEEINVSDKSTSSSIESIKQELSKTEQKSFFEFPGPLYKVIISPSSLIVNINEKKKLCVIARDKNKRQIDSELDIKWHIKEGQGHLNSIKEEIIEYTADNEPGITILEVIVKQNNIECSAECIITVTEQLFSKKDNIDQKSIKKGLPGYTYNKAPGKLWRSKFDQNNYLIIINNAHADFIYASRNKMRKLKYITKLYAKELVLENFSEVDKEQLLERMIELSLYTEENLK